MKVFTTFFASMLLTVLVYSQPCSDLFISEIVYGEQGISLTGGGNAEFPIKNYSVELFNPTDASINLANYKIELFTEDAVTASTTITLSGTVAAKETFVVSNPNSTTDVTNLSDQLSTGLDFDNNVVLRITKNGSVIDVVGKQGIGDEVGDINLDSLLNDPTYLEDLNLNLRSIENLVVRRRTNVMEGVSVFETENIINEWSIFPNNFIDNLGEHFNACVAAELNWKGYKWTEPELTVTEGGFSGTLEGTIKISGSLTGNIKVKLVETFHEFFTPAANPAFSNTNDFTFDVFNEHTVPSGASEHEVDLCMVTDDSAIEGNEGMGFWLVMVDENGTGAYVGLDNIFDVLIKDNETSSAHEEITQNSHVTVYPTIVSNTTTVETDDPSLLIEQIVIVSGTGAIIKRFDSVKSTKKTVELNFLESKGYYFLMVNTTKGIAIKKVIFQ